MLKEAKDALKPVYASRKSNGPQRAGDDAGSSGSRRQPGHTFDEKALQLRKVHACDLLTLNPKPLAIYAVALPLLTPCS